MRSCSSCPRPAPSYCVKAKEWHLAYPRALQETCTAVTRAAVRRLGIEEIVRVCRDRHARSHDFMWDTHVGATGLTLMILDCAATGVTEAVVAEIIVFQSRDVVAPGPENSL